MTQEPDHDYVPRAPRFTVTDTNSAQLTITRTEESDKPVLQAELLDISQHGAKLRVPVNLRFEESLQLQIEVRNSTIGYTGVASVRHIRSLDDERWVVGCAIAPPLSDEAFSFLATTAGKERRRFRRLEISANAIVRRQAQPEGAAATLHNLSSGGFCFSSNELYEVGEMVQISVKDPKGKQRIVEARICWHVDSDDGSIAGCKFTSRNSYADVCACLTEQPALSQPHYGEEPTSKLVLTTAVLAMFVPPMMTLMMQANKVSANANPVPRVTASTASGTGKDDASADSAAHAAGEKPECVEHTDRKLLKELRAESQAAAPAPATEQPAAKVSEVREWVDDTGKHRTIGKLVEVAPDYVVLLKTNGRNTKVPKRRLSGADRQYVQQWQAD
ncbi:MAG: PilZ domain-containing protein [Bythopirellula sp.]